MKSTNEIAKMLLEELLKNINNINNFKNSNYYNEILGDTSFLLAGLLHTMIKKEPQIDQKVWIDDSLITNINQVDNIISIEGIMIWGENGTTEQWVDPFYFTINLNNDSAYKFFFKDLYLSELSYDDFKENRNYYSDKVKNWKYEFN
ncbi:hypothetical protein SAMN05421594_4719 [Chryseobacterium oleae]|uniref:Uncharacterized protein n=1 Tax=Chryseobacterium oleae TaxID=491207 RepID=A0A1I5CZ06_CHROL|nr:hypothetical protein [Chryseobacterium oleae]SFN92153.1 hypothetical protein SAMN05421594_4719 [Chryseobacterium oleae]